MPHLSRIIAVLLAAIVAATALSGQVFTWLNLRISVLPHVTATAPHFPRLSRSMIGAA